MWDAVLGPRLRRRRSITLPLFTAQSTLPFRDVGAHDGGVPRISQDRKGADMRAKVGDFLVVKGTTTERHDQHAEIIAVRSEDGSPPYVVRWLVTEHEA